MINYPIKNFFFKQLEKAGFKNGQKISVRFSYAGLMEIPRSIGISNFNEVYQFIKKYFHKKLAVIIHPFIRASYVGTLYFYKDKILVNLIKSGIWEPSVAKNCDLFLIGNELVKIYRYKNKRTVFLPIGKKLKKQIISSLTDKEIKKILKLFIDNKLVFKKIKKIPDVILEFIITPDDEFYGMELEHTGRGVESIDRIYPNLFEIKNYKDIEKWDGKSDILLKITIFCEDKNKFLELINKIKPYKKEVFVEYGLLSHPAILLREQGIKTKPYISNYDIINLKI